jgi:hypothetical protein
MLAPPVPFLPEAVHGSLVVVARVCYSGPDVGEHAVRALRDIATPLADLLEPMPYAALLEEEAPDHGLRPAIHTMFIDHLDESKASVILEHLAAGQSWLRMVQFRVLGGAVSEVAADETAYAHRASKILVNVVHGDQPDLSWANGWVRAVAGDLYQGIDGAYVNFFGPDDRRIEAAYPAPTLARLRSIRRPTTRTTCSGTTSTSSRLDGGDTGPQRALRNEMVSVSIALGLLSLNDQRLLVSGPRCVLCQT